MRYSLDWLLVTLSTCVACAPGPEPCTTPGTCSRGEECLANRCVALGRDPVPAGSRRWVVTPERTAVVSAGRAREPGELSGAVRFGSAAEGSSALYVRFAPVWREAAHVDGAFLLLEPLPDAAASTTDVLVRALRVEEDWDPASLSFTHQPKLGLPASRAWARGKPPSTLRIDVTDLIRYEREHAISALGIAIKAPGGDGLGATFATGATLGVPPRLELYVR